MFKSCCGFKSVRTFDRSKGAGINARPHSATANKTYLCPALHCSTFASHFPPSRRNDAAKAKIRHWERRKGLTARSVKSICIVAPKSMICAICTCPTGDMEEMAVDTASEKYHHTHLDQIPTPLVPMTIFHYCLTQQMD